MCKQAATPPTPAVAGGPPNPCQHGPRLALERHSLLPWPGEQTLTPHRASRPRIARRLGARSTARQKGFRKEKLILQ